VIPTVASYERGKRPGTALPTPQPAGWWAGVAPAVISDVGTQFVDHQDRVVGDVLVHLINAGGGGCSARSVAASAARGDQTLSLQSPAAGHEPGRRHRNRR
jgi:hypothetical protein